MFKRMFLGIPIAALAMIAVVSLPAPSLAAVCSPPGEVVVTDPSGDGPGPETDILDITIQEVVAGPNAGKIIVTMHVASLAGTPSALWVIQWKDGTGDNTTTLGMSACEGGSPSYTYEYSTPEGYTSGTPDGGSYTADGAIEWILSRDKIGNPADGETFQQINGLAFVFALDPLPGCLPQAAHDAAAPGQYTVGSCLVDAPRAGPPVAFRLGGPVPNPTRGDVSFALDVPAVLEGSTYDAAMFDMAGRRVSRIQSGVAAAGRTLLRWNLRNASGERVRPGTYWARITVGAERRAQTVFVVN
jgi:hypothetical protein